MTGPTDETRQDGRCHGPGNSASETDSLLENRGGEAQHVDEDPPDGRERWNHPRVNRHRYISVNLSFLILGMHDGSIGLERYYAISYATVSTLFLVPFLGYVTAAFCNSWLHRSVGRRGIAFLGPAARLMGYVPMALHPPFPVLPVLLVIIGFGNGIQDSAWNTWVGNMHQANELLGIIHGSFGLGGTVAPLIVSAMVARLHLEWYTYFYVIIAVVCIELVFALWAFWDATGAVYRQKLRRDAVGGVTIRTVLSEPITWLLSVFLLAYAGAEVSLGGWIPTFMIEVRHADDFLAGVTATLFWLGLSIGRVVLGFITGRIGEKLAITGYLLLAVVFQLLYWLVPSTVGAMCFVSLMGFFLGPLFPAAVVVATKLLPPEYHITAVGFAAAIGGGGASLIPFAVGAIAQNHGVQVLQPIVLAVLLFLIGVWLAVPGGMRKGGLERA
ncbi:Major facilitator superfamily domain, general substrate transporter [Ophiocordyceps sinensis CO18]|uniref:Major facilitator superfamily domain, general substrate transporter n=1 Tax=Ophiocordyceps sinensis (strain Co18 / CGMCC 3.14243) TaxID=911162 RepID=T5APM1_OPHSC|nr:Major facilitator superfamily domain, general substrate transporter [Ophiocordyceps sinensis CO18]